MRKKLVPMPIDRTYALNAGMEWTRISIRENSRNSRLNGVNPKQQ
jgi:hypothetical protein